MRGWNLVLIPDLARFNANKIAMFSAVGNSRPVVKYTLWHGTEIPGFYYPLPPHTHTVRPGNFWKTKWVKLSHNEFKPFADLKSIKMHEKFQILQRNYNLKL